MVAPSLRWDAGNGRTSNGSFPPRARFHERIPTRSPPEERMKVAILKETSPGETRVAMVPGVLGDLRKAGFDVVVEAGAGVLAGFPDASFQEAGATVLASPSEVMAGAHALLRVGPPRTGRDGSPDTAIPAGTVVIGFMAPLEDPESALPLAAAGVTALSMELVPRTTRAQRMDALSSQASVAGYRAVLLGANHLGRFLPMLTTAAGTLPPARVLILGAGVAGLQAIATARRLGAVVEAFDVRPAVKEQVQSLGARFLEPAESVAAEGSGGYASALSEDQQARVEALLAAAIPDNDLVITTAQIPGRPAPRLIDASMVERMRPGSVIVDLAAASGGNCALTQADRVVDHHRVTVLGPTNLPASLPVHASQMYARNVASLLLHMVKDGALVVNLQDEIVAGACVAHGGDVVHPAVRERLGLPPLAPPAPPSAD
jgi:H+-translocating NAD(P) transhydrogenase subunit alpha